MFIVRFWWLISSTTDAFYGNMSGWVGDVGLISGVIIYYRKHNCHIKGCPRLKQHDIVGTPYSVCKKHHPDTPDEITLGHVKAVYNAHKYGKIDKKG